MISIVVIGQNEGERLSRCLQSIHQAMQSFEYEIIYVDSCSVDDSIERAHNMGAQVLRLIGPETTAGLGRRIGARAANGDWILFLDGDMQLIPGFIQSALQLASERNCDGICGIRTDVFFKDGIPVNRIDNVYSCTSERICIEFGGAILLSALALSSCGGWSAEPVACEEAELHARLIANGAIIIEVPVPMIIHFDHIRDSRSILSIVFSKRRLGDGQALRSAIDKHSLLSYLKFERIKYTFLALDIICIISVFGGLLAIPFIGLLQCLQIGFFISRSRLRSYISQKLFLVALIPGIITWHRRNEGFEEIYK